MTKEQAEKMQVYFDSKYKPKVLQHHCDRILYTVTAIMFAKASGTLSQGMAAKMLNMDPIRFREFEDDLEQIAEQERALWREQNPPVLPERETPLEATDE